MLPNTQKKTYLYIHGAMGSAHDLDYVRPALEAAGHTLLTLDLPGHGADATPALGITLADYVAKAESLLLQQPSPVILLAHSFGGFTATPLADRHPDKVAVLVYLAAYVPQAGENMLELSSNDQASAMGSILALDFAKKEATIQPGQDQAAWNALAADASDELKQMLASQPAPPEPLTPFTETVSLHGGIDQVRKVYIYTSAHDKIITPSFQQWIAGRIRPAQELHLNAGHMPFVTQPQALADLLLSIG